MRACSTTEEGVFGEALFTSVRSVTLKVLFVVPKGGVTTEVQCQRELLGTGRYQVRLTTEHWHFCLPMTTPFTSGMTRDGNVETA